MQTHTCKETCFKFKFPGLDTLVKVQNLAGKVVIRATRNSFSQARKISFIHELAAEGFIPDNFRWYSDETMGFALDWIIDRPLCVPESAIRTADRFMFKLLAGGAILFVLSMLFLFLRARP